MLPAWALAWFRSDSKPVLRCDSAMCHAVLSCTVLCMLCFMSRYAMLYSAVICCQSHVVKQQTCHLCCCQTVCCLSVCHCTINASSISSSAREHAVLCQVMLCWASTTLRFPVTSHLPVNKPELLNRPHMTIALVTECMLCYAVLCCITPCFVSNLTSQ